MKEQCEATSKLTSRRCKRYASRDGLCVIHLKVRYRQTHKRYCRLCGHELKERRR